MEKIHTPSGASPALVTPETPRPRDVLPGSAPPRDAVDGWTAARPQTPSETRGASLQAPQARSVAKRLATAAAQHPLAQLSAVRAHEREIGRLAPQSPRAQAAATALLQHAVSFLQHECGMSPAAILKAFTGKAAHNRTGAVLPEDVAEAMEVGNLREQIALVDVATRTLSGALLDIGSKAAESSAYRDALRANSRLRIDVVVKKYHLAQDLGGKRGYDSLVLNPKSPLQTLPQMRRERSFWVLNRNTGDAERRLVHQVRARHETGRKGINFDEHSGLPLSAREQRSLLAGHRARSGDLDVSEFDAVAHERMPLTEGSHGKVPNYDHPWIATAAAANHPLTAGISGHTYRFLSLFHDLGGDPAQMQDLRLACLAFLVPSHHSYHEVMASAAEYPQCPYNPRTDTAERLVQGLRAESRPPVHRASTRVAIALASSSDDERRSSFSSSSSSSSSSDD